MDDHADKPDTQRSLWRELAESVEQFAAAWEDAPPIPQIEDHLPEPGSLVRRMALVELIKVDLHQRFVAGPTAPRLDDYVRDWPELQQAGNVPPDLIFEEIQLRRQAGEQVDLAEYTGKFPKLAKPLTHLSQSDARIETSAMLAMRKAKGKYKPGDSVDDFELLSILGRGGFATVFLARQKSMQRLVALKISSDQGAEPQTLAQLDHPNIVRVYDQRQIAETAEHNQRLLYMQYVPGGTLMDALNRMRSVAEPDAWTGATFLHAVGEHMHERGQSIDGDANVRSELAALTWPQTVARIGRQLALALHYAHGKAVLHRDLKPANVLLTSEGMAKLVDFNVSFCSKVEGASPQAYFGGSLPYMSPEQIEVCNPEYSKAAEDLTERSDIFSLGVLLFELLTGKRPFDDPVPAANWGSVLDFMSEQRLVGLPRSRIEEAFGTHHLLRHAIMKCLEPAEERRFKSGQELAMILQSCESGTLDEILFPVEVSWKRSMLENVVLVVAIMTVIPSALAALFITNYNLVESVPDASHGLFKRVREIINGIAFPLAGILILSFCLPVAAAMRLVRRRGRQSDLTERQRQTLRNSVERAPLLGHWCASICVIEWFLAGLLYPIVLGTFGELTPYAWADFFGSHLLAGLTVAAYTFFGVTLVAVWYWQNQLLGSNLTEGLLSGKPRSLLFLNRLVPIYQMVSALIPMASVALLVIWGNAENKFALGVMSIASLIGVAACFWMARQIQSRLNELDELF